MLSRLINDLDCEVCGGELDFDYRSTTNDYLVMTKASVSNVFDKVENIVNKHLVYKCKTCGQKYRRTYKEIEYSMRRQITYKILMLLVREQVLDTPIAVREKFLIYCGKCGGIDGTGCCPKSMFNKCEIKRFPADVI